jgi:hypothetical protein
MNMQNLISNKAKEIFSYLNGNTSVSILEDGTKIRTLLDNKGEFFLHPESIDVKITQYCDLGCKYCHEESTESGTHSDLSKLLEVLSDLPSGVELAIGGGNPLSHPQLIEFLRECKLRGWIPNLTVNQGHLFTYKSLLEFLISENLIYGLGISIMNRNYKLLEHFLTLSDHIVFHCIAGVTELIQLKELIELSNNAYKKILILGYKQFGFGVKYYSTQVQENLNSWIREFSRYFERENVTFAFDNLALEQLKMHRFFSQENWEKLYMGDDFISTMYIDAVKEEYAPTSRSSQRTSWEEKPLLEFFQSKG